METNIGKIDFFVEIDKKIIVSDKFIVSDGKNLFLLRTVEDLAILFRRGWLVHVQPLLSVKGEIEEPSIYGIELVFRSDLILEPVDYSEKVIAQDNFIINSKKLGQRIKQIRLDKRLDQEMFLGSVDKETVNRWEEGEEIPPIEICMFLSKLVNCSLEVFLYGKDYLG